MNPEKTETNPGWMEVISKYNFPDSRRSWWQVINSVGPYILLWVAMVYTIEISYLLTLGLAVLAAGFMIRIFIIFHDCGHGSFFKSKRLRKIVGIITGLIVFTPYHKWHYEHKVHHQTVGNLDKRGVGDVMTLTVDEYRNLSPFRKLYYRIYRNPVVLFIIAPILVFTVAHRFTRKYLCSFIFTYTGNSYYRSLLSDWMENLSANTDSDPVHRHGTRGLAVLCSASVQTCSMGEFE
jgi:acyl-lipid omega-6 desaturase (Delta-12 desaturase)